MLRLKKLKNTLIHCLNDDKSIKWTLKGKGNVMSIIEIKIDDEVIVNEDTKQFIDYFSATLVEKHNKAMTKRGVFIETLNFAYRVFVVIAIVKYFPEFIQIFK